MAIDLRPALFGFITLAAAACGASDASPDVPRDGGVTIDGGASDIAPPSDASSRPESTSDAPATVDARPADADLGAHAVKWNPGHYGATFGPVLRPGQAINEAELAALGGKPGVVGYKDYLYWAAVDLGAVRFDAPVGGGTAGTLVSATTAGAAGSTGVALTDGEYWFAFVDGSYRKVTLGGTHAVWSGALTATSASIDRAFVYRFSQIDEQLHYLTTKLDVPRHLAISILPGSFTSTTIGSSVLPSYILTDPAMGASPVAGSYGWWGGSGNGNTSAAALHRPAVNERWIALARALGAYYDAEPYVEAFVVQEDSWAQGALSTNGCPDFSSEKYVDALKAHLTAAVEAFPHTNVVEQNSWVGVATDAQELADWMTKHRVAPANADTSGEAYIESKGLASSLPWGVAAYTGTVVAGSKWSSPYDMRPLIRYMPDVEAPDMGLFGHISGGPFTPSDLVDALNETLQASHVFWTMIPDGTKGILAPNDKGDVWWTNLATFLATHPLTHTAYPTAYP